MGSEIGRQLFSYNFEPSLNKGTILAVFRLSGKRPSLSDRLIKFVITFKVAGIEAFTILLLIR